MRKMILTGIPVTVAAMFAIVSVIMLSGCPKSMVQGYYGADMTPDQIRDEVYLDGSAIAAIRVGVECSRINKLGLEGGKTKDQIRTEQIKFIDEVLGRISALRLADDPMSTLNEYWYNQMLSADNPERLAVISGAGILGRRILRRIGVDVIKDEIGNRFESANLDFDLFMHAVDGYEKGVLDFKEKL